MAIIVLRAIGVLGASYGGFYLGEHVSKQDLSVDEIRIIRQVFGLVFVVSILLVWLAIESL